MDTIKVTKIESVLCRKAGKSLRGAVHLTAHHIIIHWDNVVEEETWIPYPLISLVSLLPQTLDGYYPLTIHCRDFQTISFSFEKDSEASDVFETVKGLTVVSSVLQLYAFSYNPSPALESRNGWRLYSPREEFARMGVGSRTKAWRFTDVNKDYSFCPTYPARMVVPTRISDTTLQYASRYRSKCRIPTLAYLHWANFGTITRSSQPLVGITNNRSIQDEKLIEAIFQSHHSPESRVSTAPVYGATATNLIIDARPTTNAMANVAKGAGTENMDYYKEGKKAYLGIDNIHVMRDSLNKVVEALRDADAQAYSLEAHMHSDELAASSSPSVYLDRQILRRSGWLRHLSAILDGTVLIVRNIHVNSSHVLIHCSDGWDRTAQLSSLSQLCLDPFYRTIQGFQILVEKDWLSFGHRFLDRCGHLSSDKFFLSAVDSSGGGSDAAHAFLASVQNKLGGQHHIKETSPVFHQFLECVQQIQRQFPDRFEYNDRYLKQIYYHLYSCQFGTFLFNCERDRKVGDGDAPPCDRTVSIWDFLNSPAERGRNLNPSFDPTLDNPSRRDANADMGVLYPNPREVRFWNELYGRSDEEMNGKTVAVEVQGADIIGPVEGQEDDPMSSSAVADTLLHSSSSSISPSRSILATPSSPSATAFSGEHPTPEAGRTASYASPTLSPSASGLVNSPTSSRQNSFRPDGSDSNAFTLRAHSPSTSRGYPSAIPPRESSPSPHAFSKQTEVFSGGVKSLWGKFSSNASAAFTSVQGVAKELKEKGISIPQAWDSPASGGGELQHRNLSQISDDDGGWASRSVSSTTSSSSTTFGHNSETPSDRWRTEGTRSNLSGLSLNNPWATQRQVASQATPRKTVDGLFDTTQMWSDNDRQSTLSLPPDPTVLLAAPSVSKVSSVIPSSDGAEENPPNVSKSDSTGSDPLGVS